MVQILKKYQLINRFSMTENKKTDPSQNSEFNNYALKKGSQRNLEIRQKVYDYRKDILSARDADNLQSANQELKEALSQKPISDRF